MRVLKYFVRFWASFFQVIFQLALELLRLHLPYFNTLLVGEEVSGILLELSKFFTTLSPYSTSSSASSAANSSLLSISTNPNAPRPTISIEQLLKSARRHFGGAVTNVKIENLRLACRLRVIHAMFDTSVQECVRTLQKQLETNAEELRTICYFYKVNHSPVSFSHQ